MQTNKNQIGEGFTKHYYVGSERICARNGCGHGREFIFGVPDGGSENIADSLYNTCSLLMSSRRLRMNDSKCITTSDSTANIRIDTDIKIPTISRLQAPISLKYFLSDIQKWKNYCSSEKEEYFYHSDHIGSASWITDTGGNPIQYIHYLPFGEQFVNQTISGYSERFTFSDEQVQWTCEPKPSEFPTLMTKLKSDKDSETGLSYFGARYYEPEMLNIWLSVDPMADKYPNLSPYNYCAWNPIKLVDTDGMDWYDLYNDGTIVRNDEKSKEYQNRDVIWSVDNKTLSEEFSLGTLSEQRSDNKNGAIGSYITLRGSREENVLVFKFCSEYSTVEFSLMEFALSGDKTFTRLTTSHTIRRVDTPSTDDYGSEYAKTEFFNLISHLHNHANQARPSGDDDSGDISFRNEINRLREASDKTTPVLWGIYKCRGKEKYTKDYDGNFIDPITMRPL